MKLRIFHYLAELDCFVVTDEYRRVADALGLTEWHPVVWIGRLFTLDNDYGEHWFDNWDLRETREQAATKLGLDSSDLMVIDPARFSNNQDGPCHSAEIRRQFWVDVLKSLELSYELLFAVARTYNERMKEIHEPNYLADLEARIARIQSAAMSEGN